MSCFGGFVVLLAAPLADLAFDPGEHGGHAAQPQRTHQVLQPELAGELAWRGQDLIRAQAVQPGVLCPAGLREPLQPHRPARSTGSSLPMT
jgi:hypothetical protein